MDSQFEFDHFKHGHPWCDQCGRPAVFSELFGMCHATPEFPFGVPEYLDNYGHEVTMKDWNDDRARR